MRIKKVSQVAGLVGGVTNEYSESTTDAYACDYVNNEIDEIYEKSDYSISEQVIGTWTDGKPLYRKIITGLSFTPTTSGATYTNSDLSIIKQLVDVKMTRSGSSTAVAVCSANHSQNGNTMDIFAITAFSNCDTLILEFTKTTD